MTRFHVSIETMRRWLKTSTALTTAVVMGIGQPALALAQNLPTGGTVTAGSATIAQPNASSLVIHQTSQSAITNWQTFSIGQGNSVAVVQPSTSAAMLARVTGSTASTIAGSLTATGQLMLVNPNGIAITPTGTVKAGSGFIATTLNTTDDDFLAGRARLTGNGASNAVTNAGTITVGPGGYAALIGGTVANSGTISVPMGRVGLGSGEVATLDFSGDGFLQVGVPTKADGTGALVSNSGKIAAMGGRVEIKAAAARDAARQAINMSGVVAARSVSGSDGNITLDGGDGQVQVSGKLNAASRTGKGGNVTVTGRDIRLAHARVNASGKTGGGTVKVGGDRQGTGTLAHAQTTAIDKTSIIKADATSTGTGGSVTVWSDLRTDFAGRISAQGGPNGGNGGEAEVSSHGVLAYAGTTVLTAPMGATGTLLLDPYNVTISNDPSSDPFSVPSNGSTSFTPTANDSVLSVATLQSALAGANVTVSTGSSGSQAGDITIASPLSWSANLLRLDAAHSINVAATVTVGGTGALMLNTNVGGGTGGTLDFGLTSAGFTGKIDFTGTPGQQALFFNMAQQTLVYSLADLQNINNSLSGNYALARNLDASGQTYTTGVIAGGDTSGNAPANAFTGTLTGLGHTVANLTINGSSSSYVGLIGYSTGTIRDIGITNGGIRGFTSVGGLVGNQNSGTISNVYATGSVSGFDSVGGLVGLSAGTINNAYTTNQISGTVTVGGLVGVSSGTISNAFATGAVSGGSQLGGLVGYNYYGTISNAYATGAVSGGNNIGGLVGITANGTIGNAYAMGAVSGSSNVGGLVGAQISGTVTNAYYDINTTGQSSDGAGAAGLTTAQLQNGSSASGLGSAFTVTNGLYPYLTRFYPNGAQAISGIAYADSGVTPYASNASGARSVYVDVAGQQTAVTTGANGYYYVALAGGTLSSANGGTAVVAYTRDGNVTGPVTGAYLTRATDTTQNADIWAHTLIAPTTATSLSAAETNAAALLASNSGANQTLLTAAAGSDTVPTDATSGIAALTSAGYIATSSAGFTIDQGISAYGLYARTTSGPIIVSAAQTLGGPINLTLLSASDINLNAPVQVNGNGAVNLAYTGNLNAALSDSGFTGGLTFANADGTDATTSAGGTLTVNGNAVTLLYTMADVTNVNNGLTGTYALARNLDAAGQTYTDAVIGRDDISNYFNGTLDGLGHTISNLVINKTGDNTGFIGAVFGATIRNIGTVAGSVTGNGLNTGGLIGQAGTVTLSNVFSTTQVSGGNITGGLVGSSFSITIRNAFAAGPVSGGYYVGGLVGGLQGTITNAHATGAVNAGYYAGGLVGSMSASAILDTVYASGSVFSTGVAGGLVGSLDHSTITNAYAIGAVGGSDTIGGLIGASSANTFSNVYATGAVRGTSRIGGLLATSIDDTISGAYETGAVTGTQYVGGIFGMAGRATLSHVYWDTLTSGQSIGVGSDAGGVTASLTGLTTAQLQDGTSASGLGSAFALIPNLYPYLTSFFPNGVKAISGFAYKDTGVTPLASGANGAGLVYVRFGTGAVQAVSTGANGYYYAMTANDNTPGTALAYTLADATTGAANGTTLVTNFLGNFSGVNISGGWRLDAPLGGGTLSALDAAFATATAGTQAVGMTLANRGILGVGTFTIDTPLTVSGTLDILAGIQFTSVSQTAAITADTLIVRTPDGQNQITLTNSGNRFNTLAAAGRDSFVNIYDASDVTIAANRVAIDGSLVSGITLLDVNPSGAQGVKVATAGNLTIASGASITSDNPVLAAGGTFTNNAGANAVTAITGTWLIYAAGPTGNTYGGLDSGNTAVWNTTAGAHVHDTGNRYVFAYQPMLTLTAGNLSKTYGDVASLPTATLQGSLQAGVAGAYLGDTWSNVVSGTLAPSTSTGAAATANAGTYDIIARLGTLAIARRYGLNIVNGTLTVTPRAITVAADAQSRLFGTANPALTYTIGGLGLVNGDVLSGTLATTATMTSPAGTYTITQGTLAASSNYALTYTGALLTVAPVATNPSTGGTDTGGGSSTGTGTGASSGTDTTMPGGSSNPGTSTPGASNLGAGTPAIAFRPPPSIFATVFAGTPFTPPGSPAPIWTPSGSGGFGGFTSPGYDTPNPCVAGRACGS